MWEGQRHLTLNPGGNDCLTNSSGVHDSYSYSIKGDCVCTAHQVATSWQYLELAEFILHGLELFRHGLSLFNSALLSLQQVVPFFLSTVCTTLHPPNKSLLMREHTAHTHTRTHTHTCAHMHTHTCMHTHTHTRTCTHTRTRTHTHTHTYAHTHACTHAHTHTRT